MSTNDQRPVDDRGWKLPRDYTSVVASVAPDAPLWQVDARRVEETNRAIAEYELTAGFALVYLSHDQALRMHRLLGNALGITAAEPFLSPPVNPALHDDAPQVQSA